MQQWCSDGIVVGNNDTHGLGRRHESHHIGPTSMRGTTPWREKSTVFRVWATTVDSHLGVSNQLQRTAVAFLPGHLGPRLAHPTFRPRAASAVLGSHRSALGSGRPRAAALIIRRSPDR
jgi:hypothetical protein